MSKTPSKFFQLVNDGTSADLYIFGDICAWPWESQGEQSGVSIVRQLKELDADEIRVHINSYGGDVAEGLAIYNVLREHKAKITTICDGFACSAASVVFMAGDKRVMQPASLLMIHNAWTVAMGNAAELRKTADDIETITQASVEAYKTVATIPEEEIKALMDAETWILPKDAVDYGFATDIDDEDDEDDDEPKQSAFGVIMQKLTAPAAVLESQKIEVNIDVDKLAKELTEVLMKGTEAPEQPEPKKTGWADYFERRTK
jgi:ATP-dependent Clp endopeptidase proteolytic subunit ClpP